MKKKYFIQKCYAVSTNEKQINSKEIIHIAPTKELANHFIRYLKKWEKEFEEENE